MAILSIQMDETGQIGLNPRRGKLICTDDITTVTAAGYLNTGNLQGQVIFPTDYIDASIKFNPATGFGQQVELIVLSIDHNGTITLASLAGANSIVGPVVANDIALFANAAGDLTSGGLVGTAANKAASDNTKTNVASVVTPTVIGQVATFADVNGTVQDGGVLGTAAFKTATDNTKTDVASVSGATVIGHLADFADVTGTIQDSGKVAANILLSSLANPDTAADLFSFDTIVTSTALATGGVVNLVVASNGTAQYRIRNLQLNGFGTNFSGVGGDRNIEIFNGINSYSIIPAATAQALTNAAWGSTALPFPTAIPLDNATGAGSNLQIHYQGGTTDYTAGSLVITGLVERIV